VHADLEEELGGVDVKIQNLANQAFLGYYHNLLPPYE
jgi:hypothetical protein